MEDLLKKAPENKAIFESIIIANSKIKNPCYKRIVCSISGGADSDIILDLISKLDTEKKVEYIFFNTGIEYQATKDHLKYLEERYGIRIEEIKAKIPVPLCCKRYGEPFLSKQVSEWIMRLQKHDFQWEYGTFEELYKKYPKCKAALRWWCNNWPEMENGSGSSYNIKYNMYLKEFMHENPPNFKISNKCCHYAKKVLAENYKAQNQIDLSITGIRKSEGGARQRAYKTCFSSDVEGTDEYRPIFWYKKKDTEVYKKHYDIQNSACYLQYGLDRTGCACCPYGANYEKELEAAKLYEPKLYAAAMSIFKNSYEYTKKYYEFCRKMKEKEKGDNHGKSEGEEKE